MSAPSEAEPPKLMELPCVTMALFFVPVVFVAGLVGGMLFGDQRGKREEYHAAVAGLAAMDRLPEGAVVSIREYLKARTYHYAAKLPADMSSVGDDVGPVDRGGLHGVPPVVGEIDLEKDYREFRKLHMK